MRKILDLTEMPPVYIPKRQHNLRYEFQEMTLTLYHHIIRVQQCYIHILETYVYICAGYYPLGHTYVNTRTFRAS